VLSTDGDVHLGGIDWNERLMDHVAEAFLSRHGVDPRKSASTVQVLRNDCDLAKIELTDNAETTIHCRHEGKALSVKVSRDLFESLCADLLQRTADTTELVLEQAKLKPEDLDAVVLVGSSTRMPAVPRMIRRVLGREPCTDLRADIAVAQGAAIHAAILETKFRGGKSMLADRVRRKLESVRQDNVNSHGLGVVAKNPKTDLPINHVMIPRNSRLPTSTTQIFRTVQPGQQRVTIQVLEGDAPDPIACSLLGKCRIVDLPPDLPKGAPVEVTYAFDPSGRITVTARDRTSGKQATIKLERRSGLTEQQVDAFSRLASEYMIE
jgi:molecular chaperone DnaK